MDEERSESDVVAQSGPQEGICEQGCADASSLRAQIDGEARKEENGARIRTRRGLRDSGSLMRSTAPVARA